MTPEAIEAWAIRFLGYEKASDVASRLTRAVHGRGLRHNIGLDLFTEIVAPLLREAVRERTEAAAKVAEDMAWTNKNTWALGPEQNCMKVAAAIRALEGK